MRIKLVGLVIFVLLSACAHGQLSTLPRVDDAEAASELLIIRSGSIIGATNSYKIALDHQDIFAIRIKEYIKFLVTPGEHSFSVKCFGGWSPTWKKDTFRLMCAPRQTYYFLVSPGKRCAKIEPITKEEGLAWVSKSEFLDVKQ